jgi:TolB-like protein
LPARGFTYKGRAVDVKKVGRELGVRYRRPTARHDTGRADSISDKG